jgi:superfamily II DNA or RNA helicase
VGRAARKAEGKTHFVMIDHTGVSVAHGRPDIDRKWSLEGDYKPGDNIDESLKMKICTCGVANNLENIKCWICGYDFETGLDANGNQIENKKRKLPKMIDGKLVWLDKKGDKNDFNDSDNNIINNNIRNINSDFNYKENKQESKEAGNGIDKEGQSEIQELTRIEKVKILNKNLTGMKRNNLFKRNLDFL